MVWKIIWKPVTNFLLGFIASSWCGGNMKTIMNMDSKYYSDLNITIWDDAQIGQRGGSVTQWKKQETNYMFQMKISSLNLSGWCWWCLLRWYPVLMITTDCPKMLSNTCNMYLVIILHWCDIWAHPVTIEHWPLLLQAVLKWGTATQTPVLWLMSYRVSRCSCCTAMTRV